MNERSYRQKTTYQIGNSGAAQFNYGVQPLPMRESSPGTRLEGPYPSGSYLSDSEISPVHESRGHGAHLDITDQVRHPEIGQIGLPLNKMHFDLQGNRLD